MQEIITRLATSCRGVIVDPQLGGPLAEDEALRERITVVEYSWWFVDGPLDTPERRGILIEELARVLPEAVRDL